MLGIVLQTAGGALSITVPSAVADPLLFPEQTAAAVLKADADTAQWQAFAASLDADIEEFILGSYQYTSMTRAADYALGYYCLKDSDPTTAADYAGKAIGAALSCARDNHQASIGHWQIIGDGDDVETDFELPGTEIVAGTLTVYNLATADPAGTSGTVDPADYTLVGTTITFDTAPASGRKIWATCIYHDGDLRYQQTGGGTGGVNDGPYDADQLYADRFFSKSIVPVLDWCWEFAEFTTELKDELLQALVDSFDMSADWSYAPPTSVKSNYGVGRWINCCYAAIGVQGRHADASRLKSEIETMWTTVAAQFDSPATGQATLKGGFTSEGLSSYGRATAENLMLATAALGAADWATVSEDAELDAGQWAGDHIRFLLHARYDETSTDYSGQARPGLVFEAGDNSGYPVACPPKANFAIASGISSDTSAAAYARYLVINKDGDHDQDCWDVLFYDPAGTATNWTTDTPGLSWRAEGTGIVLARSAWDYASSWVALHCGNRGADHAEPSAGYMVAYRGADRLLINGRDVGRRYNPDGYSQSLGSLANHVVIDDAGAGIQTNRWNNTYTYGGSNPGVTVPDLDESNGHVVSAFDYKNIYYRNTGATNPVTELDATVCFIPASGLVFRYDRITTGSASYTKELRYHVAGTTHPWNTGTFTLTKPAGSTTSALAFDVSAADLKTAIDGIYSVSTTVVKTADGEFEVTFPAGTNAIMTGASSESGGGVRVYDFHPTGDAGAGTIQAISHTLDISGVQQQDVSSSRMFLRVDSTDTLAKTTSLVNCAESGETARLCRQLRFRVTDSVTVSRLATAIQLTSTATGSMDDCVFVTGDNGELEGYVVDSLNIAVWFRKAATISMPEVLDITCSGTVTHHITGLTPSTVYELTGAVESTFTTNAYGNAIFTTSATDPEITIADYEPEVGDPVFSMTWVPDDDVGITDTLAANFGDVYIVKPIEFNDDGKAHLLIGQHNGGNVGIYSWGTGFEFTLEEVLDWDGVSGGILGMDIDHDGTIDAAHWGEGSGYDSIIWDGAETYSLLQSNWWGGHNYITSIYENEGTGYLETYEESWPDYSTSLTVPTRVCGTTDGTDWALLSTGTAGPDPGIPSGTITNMESYLWDGTPENKSVTQRYISFFYRAIDLTGDGSATDLIACMFRGYYSQQRCWLLTNDGDDTYTEQNATWGIPTGGGHTILPSQPGHQRPFYHFPGYTDASWYDFAGSGRQDLFISNGTTSGSYYGHYRWNGSSYTRLTSSPITARLGGSATYPRRMYAIDFMHRGILDLVLQNPRSGVAYIFINDGSGDFTEYDTVRCWDNQGLDFLLDETTGLMHMVCGGDSGVDSGVTGGSGANVLSIYENTSTDVGNWLGVKLRRTGHANKFAVGAKVEVHTAGQSFSGASLLRRWYARPDGQALIFGLANAATADVKVTWPDGTTSTQTSVSQGQVIVEDGT